MPGSFSVIPAQPEPAWLDHIQDYEPPTQAQLIVTEFRSCCFKHHSYQASLQKAWFATGCCVGHRIAIGKAPVEQLLAWPPCQMTPAQQHPPLAL